jgi:hypothetical protein
VQRIFLLQLVVFIVAGVLFSWTPLRLGLVTLLVLLYADVPIVGS